MLVTEMHSIAKLKVDIIVPEKNSFEVLLAFTSRYVTTHCFPAGDHILRLLPVRAQLLRLLPVQAQLLRLPPV